MSALERAQQSVDAAGYHVSLAEAAEYAVDSLLGLVGFGGTQHLTCEECDAVANLIAVVRDEETAREFVYDHSLHDEPGDRHYGMEEEHDRFYTHGIVEIIADEEAEERGEPWPLG